MGATRAYFTLESLTVSTQIYCIKSSKILLPWNFLYTTRFLSSSFADVAFRRCVILSLWTLSSRLQTYAVRSKVSQKMLVERHRPTASFRFGAKQHTICESVIKVREKLTCPKQRFHLALALKCKIQVPTP